MKKRILLICPASSIKIYDESKISVGVGHFPYLSLASLAGEMLANGHSAKILDLSISEEPLAELNRTVISYSPDFVGITSTTGMSEEAGNIASVIKKINPKIITISGGVHPSIFPKEMIEKHNFDYSIFGEGEKTLLDLVEGIDVSKIDGLAYRSAGGEIIVNNPRKLIEDLDTLALPAFHLYNSKNYHSPRISSRKSPVAPIETSRGCPFNCIYCNKKVFERKIRFKSAQRVVDEMEILLNLGYREIHIWDDCFSAVLDHPKKICDEIIRRNLKVIWNVYNGIRVDRIDEELLVKLKNAGCYQISIGVESGDQEILDRSKKGITLDQVRNATKLAKKSKIEVLGFFLIGLPGETLETVEKTILFAKELDLDLTKVGIATPIPGTEFFDEWKEKKLIISYDWKDYTFHTPKRIADYPGLDKDIFYYYNLFWKKLYINPYFILKRFWRGLKNGDIFFDAYYFLKILFKFKW